MNQIIPKVKLKPLCPVFGECGGCQFQDWQYADELKYKQDFVARLFAEANLPSENISPIVPSPEEYRYRCRLDLKFLKIKSGEMFMGFSPVRGYQVVAVESCPIAMEAISRFLPQLCRDACVKMPAKYRNANLTVKTGDDGRVFWGGIGRRSLRMSPEDFLWTEIDGKRIFYSLETFFQANLSILPGLIHMIRSFQLFDRDATFFDLYGGVGLFGMVFADEVKQVVLVEENRYALECARHTMAYNRISNVEIFEGRMEDEFKRVMPQKGVAMIDPPRAGLSTSVRAMLGQAKDFSSLVYLSCNPETLVRDLQELTHDGWKIQKVIPFDFFPKTRHVETLALLHI